MMTRTPTTAIRWAYLAAAEVAVKLLGDPAVARVWTQPSALAGLSVGGLAAHLASQVEYLPRVLAEPAGNGDRVDLAGHYERVRWLGAELDEPTNVAIREGGEQAAAGGPEQVAARAAAALADLRTRLPAESADRAVSPPAGPWQLQLDDFLVTRLMEIAVHSDDLACSVGIQAPALPAAAVQPVVDLLIRLALRRHGATAVVRALSRTERAPATISAFHVGASGPPG